MNFEDIYTNNLAIGIGLVAFSLFLMRPYWLKGLPRFNKGFWKHLGHGTEDDIVILMGSPVLLVVGLFLIIKYLYEFI